jgi:hypothetical protein
MFRPDSESTSMTPLRASFCFSVLIASAPLTPSFGQFAPAQEQPADAEQTPGGKPAEIADEPKAINPATLLPEALAKKATVEFKDATLQELAAYIQEQTKRAVLIDQQDILADGGSIDVLITDHLNDDPLYLLLDRLETIDLAWYQESEVLHITTVAKADERQITVPYVIGNLIDAGFEAGPLMQTIRQATGGNGSKKKALAARWSSWATCCSFGSRTKRIGRSPDCSRP